MLNIYLLNIKQVIKDFQRHFKAISEKLFEEAITILQDANNYDTERDIEESLQNLLKVINTKELLSERLQGLDDLIKNCHLFPLNKLNKNSLKRLDEICILSAHFFKSHEFIFTMSLDDNREDLIKKLLNTSILNYSKEDVQHKLYLTPKDGKLNLVYADIEEEKLFFQKSITNSLTMNRAIKQAREEIKKADVPPTEEELYKKSDKLDGRFQRVLLIISKYDNYNKEKCGRDDIEYIVSFIELSTPFNQFRLELSWKSLNC